MDAYRRAAALFAAPVLLLPCAESFPQSYPSKPVRVIVSGPAAGGADVITRPIAQKLSEALGQQFVVENRPGAAMVIAGQTAAAAPADGYTLLLATASNFSIAPFLLKKRPYEPMQDFTPVTLIAKAPLLMTVHPSLPARTVKELIALARAKPGQLLYGSNGTGSFSHLTSELFCRSAGVSLTHVPYKGGTPAALDTVTGQVQMVVTAVPTLLPQVRAARLRALAVTSASRSPALGDLPTLAESGLTGFESVQWYAFFLPKNAAPAITAKLHAETQKAVGAGTMKPLLENEGAELVVSGPEALASFLRADIARWRKVIHESKLELQ